MSEEDLYFEAITFEESATSAGDFRRAVEAYAELLKKFPGSFNVELHGAALFSMGEIYLGHLSDPGRGKWAFSEIRRRFPDSSWDARAIEELNRFSEVFEISPPGFDASSLGLGSAGMTSYSNSYTGFAMTFPRGSFVDNGKIDTEIPEDTWVISESAADAIDGMEVFAYKSRGPVADLTESPATVNVIVKFMDADVNVIELASVAGQALQSMNGVRQLEEKAVNLSGDLCVISKYESRNAGKTLTQIQAYFARDRRAFIVTAAIEPMAGGRLDDEVMEIIKTFKIAEFTR